MASEDVEYDDASTGYSLKLVGKVIDVEYEKVLKINSDGIEVAFDDVIVDGKLLAAIQKDMDTQIKESSLMVQESIVPRIVKKKNPNIYFHSMRVPVRVNKVQIPDQRMKQGSVSRVRNKKVNNINEIEERQLEPLRKRISSLSLPFVKSGKRVVILQSYEINDLFPNKKPRAGSEIYVLVVARGDIASRSFKPYVFFSDDRNNVLSAEKGERGHFRESNTNDNPVRKPTADFIEAGIPAGASSLTVCGVVKGHGTVYVDLVAVYGSREEIRHVHDVDYELLKINTSSKYDDGERYLQELQDMKKVKQGFKFRVYRKWNLLLHPWTVTLSSANSTLERFLMQCFKHFGFPDKHFEVTYHGTPIRTEREWARMWQNHWRRHIFVDLELRRTLFENINVKQILKSRLTPEEEKYFEACKNGDKHLLPGIFLTGRVRDVNLIHPSMNMTALCAACVGGHFEVVEYLVNEYGGWPRVDITKGVDGKLPIEIANENEFYGIVQLLECTIPNSKYHPFPDDESTQHHEFKHDVCVEEEKAKIGLNTFENCVKLASSRDGKNLEKLRVLLKTPEKLLPKSEISKHFDFLEDLKVILKENYFKLPDRVTVIHGTERESRVINHLMHIWKDILGPLEVHGLNNAVRVFSKEEEIVEMVSNTSREDLCTKLRVANLRRDVKNFPDNPLLPNVHSIDFIREEYVCIRMEDCGDRTLTQVLKGIHEEKDGADRDILVFKLNLLERIGREFVKEFLIKGGFKYSDFRLNNIFLLSDDSLKFNVINVTSTGKKKRFVSLLKCMETHVVEDVYKPFYLMCAQVLCGVFDDAIWFNRMTPEERVKKFDEMKDQLPKALFRETKKCFSDRICTGTAIPIEIILKEFKEMKSEIIEMMESGRRSMLLSEFFEVEKVSYDLEECLSSGAPDLSMKALFSYWFPEDKYFYSLFSRVSIISEEKLKTSESMFSRMRVETVEQLRLKFFDRIVHTYAGKFSSKHGIVPDKINVIEKAIEKILLKIQFNEELENLLEMVKERYIDVCKRMMDSGYQHKRNEKTALKVLLVWTWVAMNSLLEVRVKEILRLESKKKETEFENQSQKVWYHRVSFLKRQKVNLRPAQIKGVAGKSESELKDILEAMGRLGVVELKTPRVAGHENIVRKLRTISCLSPHFIKCVGSNSKTKQLFLYFEYVASRHTLKEYLLRNYQLCRARRTQLVRDVLEVIIVFQKHNFFHRDLSIDQFFLDENGHLFCNIYDFEQRHRNFLLLEYLDPKNKEIMGEYRNRELKKVKDIALKILGFSGGLDDRRVNSTLYCSARTKKKLLLMNMMAKDIKRHFVQSIIERDKRRETERRSLIPVSNSSAELTDKWIVGKINKVKKEKFDIKTQMKKMIVEEEDGEESFQFIADEDDEEEGEIVMIERAVVRGDRTANVKRKEITFVESTEKDVLLNMQLQSDYVVRCYGVYFDEDMKAYCVLEDFPTVTLEQYVEKNPALSKEERRNIVVQIAQAMKYLHSLDYIHLELTPSRIFIDEKRKRIKLDNFDFTPMSELGKNFRDFEYIPYELVNYERDGKWPKMSEMKAIDLYFFALTTHFVMTGFPPFDYPGHKKRFLLENFRKPNTENIEDNMIAELILRNTDMSLYKRDRSFEFIIQLLDPSLEYDKPPLVEQLSFQHEICGLVGCNKKCKSVCPKCKTLFYCSKTHQQFDWKFHKTVCPVIRFTRRYKGPLSKSLLTDPVRNKKCKHLYEFKALEEYLRDRNGVAMCVYEGCEEYVSLRSLARDSHAKKMVSSFLHAIEYRHGESPKCKRKLLKTNHLVLRRGHIGRLYQNREMSITVLMKYIGRSKKITKTQCFFKFKPELTSVSLVRQYLRRNGVVVEKAKDFPRLVHNGIEVNLEKSTKEVGIKDADTLYVFFPSDSQFVRLERQGFEIKEQMESLKQKIESVKPKLGDLIQRKKSRLRQYETLSNELQVRAKEYQVLDSGDKALHSRIEFGKAVFEGLKRGDGALAREMRKQKSYAERFGSKQSHLLKALKKNRYRYDL